MAVIFATLHRMKSGLKKILFGAAGLSLLLAARADQPKLPPVGHATNFTSVAYFEPPNEQAVKFRLTGAEAIPLPGAQLDLRKMKVEKFATDGKLEATVLAPQCFYSLDGVVNSSGPVEFNSGDGKLRVEGEGFVWQQTNMSLVISNRVRTVIKAGISKMSLL
jgi:hypothetical protein